MLMDYNWLVLAHLLLFVYWLGGDLGVFWSSRYVVDPTVSVDARVVAGKIMHALDLVPRVCLVLILPVGISMSAARWGLPVSGAALAVIWIAALAWLAIAVTVYLRGGTALARRLAPADTGVRIGVLVSCAGVAAWGFAGGGPLAEQPWLAGKFGLFALLVACGLAIRVALRPFVPAFRQLVVEGSKPELERQLAGSIAKVRPFVLLIWAGLVASAALGVFKPVG